MEYIIHQKRENARKLKDYEKQKKKDESDLVELAALRQSQKTDQFLKMETSLISKPSTSSLANSLTKPEPNLSSAVGSGISNMINGRDKELPSFWIPAMTPQSKKTKLKKPENVVYCPMSGKPLKANLLIDVHFTPTNDSKVCFH